MAKACLRLSDQEFWDMAPKTFFAMLSEYNSIENDRAARFALAYHGKKLPEVEKAHAKKPAPKLVNPFFF